MRSLALVPAALIAVALAACGATTVSTSTLPPESLGTSAQEPSGTTAGSDAGQPILLGAFGPVTGPTGGPGTAQINGAQLRVDEINEAGGVKGRQLKLITCDDKSSPEQGTACFNRLVNQDHVVAISGTLHSPIVAATAPLADKYQVPMVAGGTGVAWCDAGDYVWRGIANTDVLGASLTQAIRDAGIKTMSIIYENTDYGISGFESLSAIDGVSVLASGTYNNTDRDFSAQIINLINSKPDAIGFWGLTDNAGAVIRQIREQGWEGPIFGGESLGDPNVAIAAGDAINGTVFALPLPLPDSPEGAPNEAVKNLLTKYVNEHGEMPQGDNVYRGYDSITILATAIEAADSTDGPALRDAINEISDLEGIGATFTYAPGGCEGVKTSRIWEWQAGKIVEYHP